MERTVFNKVKKKRIELAIYTLNKKFIKRTKQYKNVIKCQIIKIQKH